MPEKSPGATSTWRFMMDYWKIARDLEIKDNIGSGLQMSHSFLSDQDNLWCLIRVWPLWIISFSERWWKLRHLWKNPSIVCPLRWLSHPQRMPTDILNPSVYSTDHVPRLFTAHLPPTFSCCSVQLEAESNTSKCSMAKKTRHQKDLPGRSFQLKEHPGRRQAFWWMSSESRNAKWDGVN